MKITKRIGCLLGILLLCCGCGQDTNIYLEEYEDAVSEIMLTTEQVQDAEAGEEKKSCYVYICGAVARPGVYVLPEGGRIYEVLELAGGLTDAAADTLLNQAEPITDGMMIRVYTREEAEQMSEEQKHSFDESSEDARVDINTAGIAELMTLPGIGSAKAEAILGYRRSNGDFSSIEDLMNVPGIKEGIFQQMKEHIKVNK